MSYAHVPNRRTDIEGPIVRRAWADPVFRRRLRKDPKGALEEELGIVLPARLRVSVVEETPDQMCIVIPVDISGIGEKESRAVTG